MRTKLYAIWAATYWYKQIQWYWKWIVSILCTHILVETFHTDKQSMAFNHQNDITFDIIWSRMTIGELFQFICESEGRGKGGSLEKWDKRVKSVGRWKVKKLPFSENYFVKRCLLILKSPFFLKTILSRSVFLLWTVKNPIFLKITLSTSVFLCSWILWQWSLFWNTRGGWNKPFGLSILSLEVSPNVCLKRTNIDKSKVSNLRISLPSVHLWLPTSLYLCLVFQWSVLKKL